MNTKKIKTDPNVSVGPYAILHCPEPGNNCAVLTSCITATRSNLDVFYRMYNHDSVSSYFTYQNWESLFPQLTSHKSIISNLKTGNYKVVVDSQGNILIADGNVTVTDNDSYLRSAIFGFKAAPCN